MKMEMWMMNLLVLIFVNAASCLPGEWVKTGRFIYFLSESKSTYQLANEACAEMDSSMVADGVHEDLVAAASLLKGNYPNDEDAWIWISDCSVMAGNGKKGNLQDCTNNLWYYVCRKGAWHEFRNHLYYVTAERMSWNETYSLCLDLNSRLVVPTSYDEIEFIDGLTHYSDFWTGLASDDPDCICTSDPTLRNQCTECRNSWRGYDGEVSPYNSWRSGSPSNENHDCIKASSRGLIDSSCHEDLNILCKKAIENGTCDDNHCAVGSTCEDFPDDIYTCICSPGYTGMFCEIQIDECASNPCMSGGFCVDGRDRFECYCPQGVTGVYCEGETDDQDVTEENPIIPTNDNSNIPGSTTTRSTTDGIYHDTTIHQSGQHQIDDATNSDKGELSGYGMYLLIGMVAFAVLAISAIILAVLSFIKKRKPTRDQLEDAPKYESPEANTDDYASIDLNTYQGIEPDNYLKPEPCSGKH